MPDSNPTTAAEYRTIESFPGYKFGSDGSIWSCWRQAGLGQGLGTHRVISDHWKRLSTRLNKSGLSMEVYIKNQSLGSKRSFRVGRLILEAFKGPCPQGMECRHLDGNAANNHVDNLTWGTHVENIMDRNMHGNSAKKLNAQQVFLIRADLQAGETHESIAKKYGLHKSTVCKINNKRLWSHLKDQS